MHAIAQTVDDYVNQFEIDRFLNPNMLRHLRLYHFPIYSHVFMQQDEQHMLYFLVEGQVQCSHYHLNGKLAVFALSDPFTSIGDLEILSDDPLYSDVIATQPTTMLGINREAVHQYGKDDPRFLHFLLDELRDKLYKSNSLQTGQILPLSQRLALYLLSKSAEEDQVILPEKDTFASLLGTTTRHLNRVLKEFNEAGTIANHYPTIHIKDHDALVDQVEQ